MATVATQSSGVDATKLETELTAVDAGVLKDIPAKTTLTVNGTAMTPAQIDAQVKSYLATLQAVDAAKAQYQAAVVARRNMQVQARNFYLQLKKVIVAYFGAQAPQLADFGLTPAKAKAPKTGAEKAIIAAKTALTKKARGTTSKKEKATINPGTGQPAVTIGGNGKPNAIPPTVIDAVVPGSTPAGSSGSSTATSTAASGTGGTPGSTSSAPASVAGGASTTPSAS